MQLRTFKNGGAEELDGLTLARPERRFRCRNDGKLVFRTNPLEISVDKLAGDFQNSGDERMVLQRYGAASKCEPTSL